MKEVRYVQNVIEDDGVFLPVFKYAKISKKYTKRYHGCLERLMLLSYMELYLIEWLAEQPNGDCVVRTDKTTRKSFIDFILRITTGKEKDILYKDSSVKTAMSTLKRTRFLIPFPDGTRGVCWVNPAFYYRNGSEELRLKMIDKIKKEIGEEDITYIPQSQEQVEELV